MNSIYFVLKKKLAYRLIKNIRCGCVFKNRFELQNVALCDELEISSTLIKKLVANYLKLNLNKSLRDGTIVVFPLKIQLQQCSMLGTFLHKLGESLLHKNQKNSRSLNLALLQL